MKVLSAISIIFVCVLLSSCSSSSSCSMGDLSFAGITIGKEFPDSLKNNGNFIYSDKRIPYYDGYVLFNLPNTPEAKIGVVATTDLEGVVVGIDIYQHLEEASDFYDMLKSKYGLPDSDFGNTDCSLQHLISKFYEQLGYKYYDYTNADISGERVLGTWKPLGFESIIVMIADTYCSMDYGATPNTSISFKYVDVDKYTAAQKAAERRNELMKREEYRKENSQSMNQDF